MKNFYIKLTSYLSKGDKSFYDISKKDQLSFINLLDPVRNDYDRSFNQYQSQIQYISKIKTKVFNLFAITILPFLLIISLLKGFFVKFKFRVQAILQKNDYSGCIPFSLRNEYDLHQEQWFSGWCLRLKDFWIILDLLPFLFKAPYFVLKCVYKVSLYSNMIVRYNPEAIVVFNEYSFTSSIMTFFCERKGIEHINVMHGEKLFFIRDSFFRFTRMYVWDQFYIDLFSKMKSPTEQFIPELPPFMSFDSSEYKIDNYNPDYTYYLAIFNEDEIRNIIKSMEFAIKMGKKVLFRPHPRYSDASLLRKYVDEACIEYPDKVDIMSSIANTGCAVGVYTTVLNQAYHVGKEVIIDDLNFPHIFSKLKELDYSLLFKPVKHLSLFQV